MDALFVPAAEVRLAAKDIAERNGLEPDWLNDGAKGFMPETQEEFRTVLNSEFLLVQVPPPKYLLAMKLQASRDERDLVDAARLFNLAKFTSAQDAIDHLTRTYPAALLLPKHRYVVDDVVTHALKLRQQQLKQQARAASQRRHPSRPDQHQVGPSIGF